MKTLNLLLMIAAVFVSATVAQRTTVKPKDFKVIEGAQWVGTLTYRDYSSGKQTSIKSNVTISRDKKNSRVWIFDYQYPDEPKANSRDEVVLNADGRTFDGEAVVEFDDKRGLAGSRLITTKRGTDNDKPATFRFTYEFWKRNLTIKKEVKIDGTDEYFERNQYRWSR